MILEQFGLIHSIIVLIIGIVIFSLSRVLPPVANTIAYWLGILIAVIGIILVVIAILG